LDLPYTEMEFLCNFMDNMLTAESMLRMFQTQTDGVITYDYTRYHVYDHGRAGQQFSGKSMLARTDTQICVDLRSATAVTDLRITPVSAEEYDVVRLVHPNQCRPFCAAIGDLRSARQLLRDRPAEPATLVEMLRVPEGRNKVSDLTAAIRDRLSALNNQIFTITAHQPAATSALSVLHPPTTTTMPNAWNAIMTVQGSFQTLISGPSPAAPSRNAFSLPLGRSCQTTITAR